MTLALVSHFSLTQPKEFVVRSDDTLRLGGKPFYFLGTNAYYLLEQAARGDTATVKALFERAASLRMTVVRTWGFFDSSDSLNPAVVQYRPGVFNQRALRALDYVIHQARLHSIRLLIPLVNNWDDYGGMNQYVRWRAQITAAALHPRRYSEYDQQRVVDGGNGRTYRYAITPQFAHDDFYSDDIIKGWYKDYLSTILNRVSSYTNTRYKDEPMVFGWELANEPRSSDISSLLVQNWIREMSSFIKSIDAHHLVGTGEEGFDNSTRGYSIRFYNNQHWLFDGSAGVAFRANSVMPAIDFASCHLYPESWNVPQGAGNEWIRDHVRIAQAIRKPLIVGEFGVRASRDATYVSWLTTALHDGAAGAIVWHLLEGPRTNDGFGIRCSNEHSLCEHLGTAADGFVRKSNTGVLPKPQSFRLQQNYPNPFNNVTTISYSLPHDSYVNLSVFNGIGQHVAVIVDGIQSGGERKELFGGQMLASGAYFYRLHIGSLGQPSQTLFSTTKRFLLIH